MNIENTLKQAPQHIQDSPVVQAMVQFIQQQAEQIQYHIEKVGELEKTVQELKNEISRLNKTPKRPKFQPNRMEPRKRGKRNLPKNDKNVCVPQKEREEIKVAAESVPQGSRFKGYSDFKVQVRWTHKIGQFSGGD